MEIGIGSTLTLLVLGIFTDDAHHSSALTVAPLDQLAVLTNLFDGCADFHVGVEGEEGVWSEAEGFSRLRGWSERNRYVILPFCKSYGVISTRTRSPGRMCTRWTRIRPAR